MMNYKDIELTNGKTVRVYAPPVIRIRETLRRKYRVEKKIVTEKTATGKEISMVIDDDPEYLAQVEEAEERIGKEAGEMDVMFALKDEEVPEGFDIGEQADLIRMMDETWEPRTGANGRKLDYFEWDLLASPVDAARVSQAITDLISVDMEVVEATKESFPD